MIFCGCCDDQRPSFLGPRRKRRNDRVPINLILSSVVRVGGQFMYKFEVALTGFKI